MDDIRLLTAQKPGGEALFIQSHLPQIHLMAAVNFRNFAVSGVLHGVALLPAQQLDDEGV